MSPVFLPLSDMNDDPRLSDLNDDKDQEYSIWNFYINKREIYFLLYSFNFAYFSILLQQFNKHGFVTMSINMDNVFLHQIGLNFDIWFN